MQGRSIELVGWTDEAENKEPLMARGSYERGSSPPSWADSSPARVLRGLGHDRRKFAVALHELANPIAQVVCGALVTFDGFALRVRNGAADRRDISEIPRSAVREEVARRACAVVHVEGKRASVPVNDDAVPRHATPSRLAV